MSCSTKQGGKLSIDVDKYESFYFHEYSSYETLYLMVTE